jgi:hypothetical protein
MNKMNTYVDERMHYLLHKGSHNELTPEERQEYKNYLGPRYKWEMSLKEFQEAKWEVKREYIDKLLKLDVTEHSGTINHILKFNHYSANYNWKKTNKTFSLSEGDEL